MKRISMILLTVFLLSLCSGPIVHAAGWKMDAHAVDHKGNIYKDNATLSITKGQSVFINFSTDYDHNAEHGIAPVVGFDDGFKGGSLSSRGFKITTGEPADLGYKGISGYGLKIDTAKLKSGTTATLTYSLYKTDGNFSWDTFNFATAKIAKSFKLNVRVIPYSTSLKTIKGAKKSFTVKWSKKTDISGYQIQYSTSSAFKKNLKTISVAKASAVSKKITGLKSKKNYYVRVRTYKKSGKKNYYSNWSKIKKVTVK